MYSSTDMQKFWFLYQTEAQPKGVSLQSFATQKGVKYDEFYSWYKTRMRKIIPVAIDGAPEEIHEDQTSIHSSKTESGTQERQPSRNDKGGILVTIKIGDGLHIRKGGLTYTDLKLLVERLEVVC